MWKWAKHNKIRLRYTLHHVINKYLRILQFRIPDTGQEGKMEEVEKKEEKS